jgi:hypothetical protein
LFQSDDNISLFVPLLDIAMSLGSLFQGVASINDRLYLSRLNKLFEQDQIYGLFACRGFDG